MIFAIKFYNHFNPRSPHGERQKPSPFWLLFLPISTHAPRTGSDQMQNRVREFRAKFQPTLPARGATFAAAFQPRAGNISTHAPRTGSDWRRSPV